MVTGMLFSLALLPAYLCVGESGGGDALQSLRENDSHNSLLAAMDVEQYAVDRVGEGASAGNPANRLRMNFCGKGLRLESAIADESWGSEWSLESFGYGEQQIPAQEGKLWASGARVEILRAEQGITEWFENRVNGMEHGFTLTSAPQGRANGTPLRLVIGIAGDLKARTDGELDLVLMDRDGMDVLRYENLKVWDADGKILSAVMRMGKADMLWIEVNDDGASYPVTIDPTFISETKLLAPDGDAGDSFGWEVAIDGNTAVIGAYRDDVGTTVNQGSVYVFTGSGTDWTFQQKLTSSDGTEGDDFGTAVSIQGDTILVGASIKRIGDNTQQGKAYVFTRSGTVWTEQQGLLAGDGGIRDHFGSSVSLDGDYAVIGAKTDVLKGSAYIFMRSGDTWTQQQKIFPADGTDSDDFGESVAISGSTVVIGASGALNSSIIDRGAAYIYERNGGFWSLQRKLSLPVKGSGFGADVSISGETVVVFKRRVLPAYVFVRNGTTWTEQQQLSPVDEFGRVVGSASKLSGAISGDTVAFGFDQGNVGNNPGQDSVFIFERSGPTWTQSQRLIATDGLDGDSLGWSVAISGRAVISGAIGDDGDGEEPRRSQGSAYIFHEAIPEIDLTIALDRTTDQIMLEWNTQPGKIYSIEGSTDLNGFPVNVLDLSTRPNSPRATASRSRANRRYSTE